MRTLLVFLQLILAMQIAENCSASPVPDCSVARRAPKLKRDNPTWDDMNSNCRFANFEAGEVDDSSTQMLACLGAMYDGWSQVDCGEYTWSKYGQYWNDPHDCYTSTVDCLTMAINFHNVTAATVKVYAGPLNVAYCQLGYQKGHAALSGCDSCTLPTQPDACSDIPAIPP